MAEKHQETSGDNIGALVRTAAGWQLLTKGIRTALQMISTIVLARLLIPADFGIVAMAVMVTGLANIFRELGLGQALVQRKEISDHHTRSAFWGTLLMALVLYAGVFASAPHVGAYFNEPRMIPVLKLIALTFVLSPFAVVPRSLLQRELDFKTPFFAGLASSFSYGAVGITMAIMGYGYWALVGAALAGGLVNTVALCALTGYIPPIIPSFRGIGDLYGFGVGVTGIAVGHYIAEKIDYFVIGRRLDSDALGLYTHAYSFVTYPALIAGSVASVFFPAFSRMQDDKTRMQSAYGRVTTLLATVFWPMLAIATVAAPELIPTVFGEQWTPSVLPAQIMVVIGLFKITSTPAGGVIKATAYVYGSAWRQFFYGALIGIGAWYTAPHGIVAVALAVACANIVHYLLIGHLVWVAIDFGLTDYFRTFRGPVVTTVVSSAVGVACRFGSIAAGHGDVITLLLTILPAALVAYLLTRVLPFREVQSALAELDKFQQLGMRAVRFW
ncbi:MAG: lipopolysaccharide biosynthesis protein [Armatimonadota bacterium]